MLQTKPKNQPTQFKDNNNNNNNNNNNDYYNNINNNNLRDRSVSS